MGKGDLYVCTLHAEDKMEGTEHPDMHWQQLSSTNVLGETFKILLAHFKLG